MFYFKQQHERDMNPVSYCKQFHYKKKEIMSASGAFHSSIPTLVLHWQHFNKTNKEKLTFGQHCTNKDTRKENVFNIQECFDFKMRSTHQKCNIKMISINNNKHDLKKKKIKSTVMGTILRTKKQNTYIKVSDKLTWCFVTWRGQKRLNWHKVSRSGDQWRQIKGVFLSHYVDTTFYGCTRQMLEKGNVNNRYLQWNVP